MCIRDSHLPKDADIALEYALGFGFGWSIFQSLFMRGMAGGSYMRALSSTFFPELLSMNCLMAGMVPVMTLGFLSRICGVILVPGVVPSCDKGQFPWPRRYESRRIVW